MTATGGARRTYYMFWVLLIVFIGAGAAALLWPRLRDNALDEGNVDAAREEMTLSVRSVVLYFADAQARALTTERRELPVAESLEERVEMTLRALVQGPQHDGAAAVLPREVSLSQAFYVEEETTLYLDFNTALLTQHPGGSAAEYYTLSALARTIGANFPEVTQMQILVDGQPIDSLAGHFDTSKPLEVVNWQ